MNPVERIRGLKVTSNLLPMLGVQPLLGRLFAAGEDRQGAEHEVILSHRLWQRRFNGDPQVLGKIIQLTGEGYTVVGVMPPHFAFPPFWATHTELWVPNAFGNTVSNRGGNHLRVFARLRSNITLKQAQQDISIVTARLEKQYPATNRSVIVRPLRDNVVRNVQTPLLLLLGAVLFVLLIACANVAHMLLARTADRQKEIAIRTALGAGRARVISQVLTESLLLSFAGAAGGLLLATWGIRALVAFSPADLPRVELIRIDGHVLLFVLAATLATAFLFGLIPAVRSTSGNLSGELKEGGRGDSDGVEHSRVRGFLVASEFALAFVLLIGAGLMIRSFVALQALNPGFDPHNVVSMVVSVAGTKEEAPTRRSLFYRQLLEKVKAIPGVEATGAINHLPLAGDLWDHSFVLEGRPRPRPGEFPRAVYRIVMPGYFETMRLALRRGRPITIRDDNRAPGVLVINEQAARRYWPGDDPIGKRVALDSEDAKGPEWLTIIGVVSDAKQANWAAEPDPEIYLAALQNRDFLGESGGLSGSHMNYITLVARTTAHASETIPSIKNAVLSLDRNLPISDVATMDRVITDTTAPTRFEMLLLAAFAGVALTLAAIGIYGVMSYAVSRRTREIGIRISLGAGRLDVLRMVLRQGMSQAGTGATVGIGIALLLSQLMRNLLYGITPSDPFTFAAVAVVLGITAAIAICIPARKAMRIEPMLALRSE